MEALACLYHQAKFPHAACPLFEKCLEKRKMIIGPSAPLTINVMGSLAEVYKDIGENFKAETLYLEVLQKFKEVKGDKHPATLNLHHIIAGFYAYKKVLLHYHYDYNAYRYNHYNRYNLYYHHHPYYHYYHYY